MRNITKKKKKKITIRIKFIFWEVAGLNPTRYDNSKGTRIGTSLFYKITITLDIHLK